MTHPALARAARRLADQQKTQAQAPPVDRFVWATVKTVTAGAGRAGKAAVTVTWRGASIPADYLNQYTPVVNDRVLCAYVGSHLIVVGST